MPSNIQGLDTLVRQLNSIKKVSPHAILAGALTLQKYAQENAPVLTGFLRGSPESHETSSGAEVEFHANYAYYQEFGTSKMPAQPYVRPAIDEHGKDIVQAVKDEVQKEIKGKL